MSIIKPYTFVAGNKARANEVNEDFDVLYQQVNTNITNIANIESDIENLDATKANINGSSSQRFAVADPVSSGDAINKRTLIKQIGNSIDYIGGLTISKDSGSPNNTILIDPGACYDSTKSIVLSLDVLTSKQNTTQAANATYYVYIIGNSTGSTTDIIISAEASVPTLPAGYTLYRKIGYYTTNSSSNISNIYYYGNTTSSPSFNIASSYYTTNSGYVMFTNGLKIQWGAVGGWSPTVYFLVPFTSGTSYIVTTSDDYWQYAGDKQAGAGLNGRAYDYCTFWTQREGGSPGTIYWIAVGF